MAQTENDEENISMRQKFLLITVIGGLIFVKYCTNIHNFIESKILPYRNVILVAAMVTLLVVLATVYFLVQLYVNSGTERTRQTKSVTRVYGISLAGLCFLVTSLTLMCLYKTWDAMRFPSLEICLIVLIVASLTASGVALFIAVQSVNSTNRRVKKSSKENGNRNCLLLLLVPSILFLICKDNYSFIEENIIPFWISISVCFLLVFIICFIFVSLFMHYIIRTVREGKPSR